MDKKNTLRNILKRQKDSTEFIPRELFVENLRKTLKNEIEHYQSLSDNKNKAEASRPKFSLLNIFKQKKILAYLAVLILLIISTVGTTFVLNRRKIVDPVRVQVAANLGSVDLKPDKQDETGIETNSKIIITTTNAAKETELKSAIKVEPQVPFDIEANSDKQFTLSFKEELKENTVYKFNVKVKDENGNERNLLWAFETKDKFRVVETLPRNESRDVPLNSGIEITLNNPNFADNFADYIEVAPATEGRFEKHNKTIVFVPSADLSPKTLYTVTLKKGLVLTPTNEVLTEDFIFQFGTRSQEGGSSRLYYGLVSTTSEFSPTEKPALGLTYYSEDSEAQVDVFTFDSADSFIASLGKNQASPDWASDLVNVYKQNTEGMQSVLSFNAPMQGNSMNAKYLQFPQSLNVGYYLVQVKIKDFTLQNWMQITNLSSYISTSSTKTLVWVNDLSTKKAVQNAKIELLGTSLSETSDEQGIAFFESTAEILKHERKPQFFRVADDKNQTLILPLNQYKFDYQFNYKNTAKQSDKYWAYLYTDRTWFKPTDTLNYWTVLRARDTNPNPNRNFELKIQRFDNNNGYWDYVDVLSQNITVRPDGTYEDTLKFENYLPGRYILQVLSEGEVIRNVYFDILKYTKPAYKIDFKADKSTIFVGETTTFRGKVSMFDGTPVPNYQLKYSVQDLERSITTDQNGEFSFEFTPEYKQLSYYELWTTYYFTVKPMISEETNVYGSATLKVFRNDIAITSDSSYQNGKARVKWRLSEIDENNFDKYASYLYRNNMNEHTPVVQKELNLIIDKLTYEAKENGEYYDFVTKKTVKTYSYTTQRSRVDLKQIFTDENGEGFLEFDAGGNETYEIKLETMDNSGHPVSIITPIYTSSLPPYANYIYNLTKSKLFSEKYKLGEEDTIKFVNNKELMPVGEDIKYLYMISKRGLTDYRINQSPEFKVVFEEADIPNFFVTGVFFNGTTYIESNPLNFIYDESDKGLNIDIQADKETYSPGEKVNLTIKATDKDGNPKESDINLSLVDEALYNIMNNNPNVASSIYSPVNPGVIDTYSSHQVPRGLLIPGGAGATGGGPRDGFKDTALFTSIKTNSSGLGATSFDLPDNVTSWKLTAQGLSTDSIPYAGSKLFDIKATLPFVIQTTTESSYLESDKPKIQIKVLGKELAAGTPVELMLNSDTLGIKDQKVEAVASQDLYYSLPDLKEGEHKLTISAKSGNLEDALVKTITVKKSHVQSINSKYYSSVENLKLEGSLDGPTTLTITDKTRAQFLSELRFTSGYYSERFDEKLARFVADGLLEKYFDETKLISNINIADYQTSSGGISLLPYSDSDLLLSAQTADLYPELVDKNALANYFESVLSNADESKERSAIALYGLAALNRPVLSEIYYFLKSKQDLTTLDKTYLGLALSKLGDQPKAREIYKEIADFESLPPFLRVNAGNNDDSLRLTALVADLASSLEEADASSLFGYIQNNSTTDILLSLEKIIYIRNSLPNLKAADTRFAYIIAGNRVEKTLTNGESFSFDLKPEELAQVKIETLEGEIGIATTWTDNLQKETVQKDSRLSISKEFRVNGNPTTTFKPNDLVKVVINYSLPGDALDGCYSVTDYLPSGLRAITTPTTYKPFETEITYPYFADDESVKFCLYEGTTRPIVYYARVAERGEFVVEETVIQYVQSPSSFNVSARGKITVE